MMSALRNTTAILGLTLLALVPAMPAAAVCPSGYYFGGQLVVPTGSNPLFSVIADFNADGKLDLATTNCNWLGGGSASISVQLGNGAGGFGAPTNYAAGNQPHGIVTGDFDEDGALDLVVANKFSNSLQVLRGQLSAGVPTGTFTSGGTIPLSGYPFQLVAGDYNEDGILDLAVAINNQARVGVLIGLGSGGIGNGTFAPPVYYTLSNLGAAIAQGDFNSDGILDLVATEYTAGKVAVLIGQGGGGVGNGTFAPAVHYAAGVEPFDFELLDYDEDGILDLAVANNSGGGVKLLHGLGSGGVGTGAFALVTTIPSGNDGTVVAADLDQDGVLDLVVGESASPGKRLRVYIGTGAGGVGTGAYTEAPPILLPNDPYMVSVAQLNGDALPDLVVSQYTGNEVIVLAGGCAPPPPDPRYPVLTRVRDVPADQGGQVYLTWLASSLDVSNGAVTSYRVWRQIPPGLVTAPPAEESGRHGATTTRSERGPGGEMLVTYWESIATLPAERLEGYGYTAATTEDSTAANPVSTAFFVSALTSNINVSYASNVVSAGSVDNTAPEVPLNVRIESSPTSAFRIAWSPNAEPDLSAYRIYRSPDAGFPAGKTVMLGTLPDTLYDDSQDVGDMYYRVAAVDVHGNEGPPSASLYRGTVGVGDGGARLALAGPWPNPARAEQVKFTLTLVGDGPARLDVFDVTGRRVAGPSLDGLGRGTHVVRLGASRPLAPGLYWVRLTQGTERMERKLVIVD